MQFLTRLIRVRLPFRQQQQRAVYRFCTKNGQPPLEEGEPKVEKVPDGEILKNTIKEVLTTIKDSAYEKAAGTKEAITKGATDFSSKANNVEDTATGHAIINIVKHAWRQTFPSHDDQVRERMELMKKRVAEQNREAERLKEFSQEELENVIAWQFKLQMQGEIPEWKRTAVQASSEAVEEKPGLAKQLKQKIASNVSKMEVAQRIQGTEEFKEYKTFKSEMHQFKEDIKERVQNHPSNVVQGSIYVYKSITNESDVAKAIKQMRLIDPAFDLFELEREAKVIFENIYMQYLRAELADLSKVCGEVALAYFKVLLKKREVEKSEPKYKYLWNVDQAFFQRAFVPDSTKLPVFVFNIKAQEVYCYISKTDPTKIIDGDDERIMQMDYMFALCPHLSPSVEEVGHSWEMIEIQPREVVKMLV